MLSTEELLVRAYTANDIEYVYAARTIIPQPGWNLNEGETVEDRWPHVAHEIRQGTTKIGFSTDPKKRMRGLPGYELVHYEPGSLAVEKAAHDILRDACVRGREYFSGRITEDEARDLFIAAKQRVAATD